MVEGSEVCFVCPICGESDFSEKSIFLRHLKIHEVKTAKICDRSRKFCDVCGKTYPNVTLLYYQFLCLEQAGERAHNRFNQGETVYFGHVT